MPEPGSPIEAQPQTATSSSPESIRQPTAIENARAAWINAKTTRDSTWVNDRWAPRLIEESQAEKDAFMGYADNVLAQSTPSNPEELFAYEAQLKELTDRVKTEGLKGQHPSVRMVDVAQGTLAAKLRIPGRQQGALSEAAAFMTPDQIKSVRSIVSPNALDMVGNIRNQAKRDVTNATLSAVRILTGRKSSG
jgi:hypothetical protein